MKGRGPETDPRIHRSLLDFFDFVKRISKADGGSKIDRSFDGYTCFTIHSFWLVCVLL
jgi:hypothetical protein